MTPRLLPWGKLDYMGLKAVGASLGEAENRTGGQVRAKTDFFPGINYFK
jgi:hypothetical protein